MDNYFSAGFMVPRFAVQGKQGRESPKTVTHCREFFVAASFQDTGLLGSPSTRVIFSLGRPNFAPLGRPKHVHVHCKKRLLIFPSPTGMSLTRHALAGKN
jgi:hypothetical protein